MAHTAVECARADHRAAVEKLKSQRRRYDNAVTRWTKEHPPVSDLEMRRAAIAAYRPAKASPMRVSDDFMSKMRSKNRIKRSHGYIVSANIKA